MEAWIILIVLFFYMIIQGIIVVLVLWKLSEIKDQMLTREDLAELIENLYTKTTGTSKTKKSKDN